MKNVLITLFFDLLPVILSLIITLLTVFLKKKYNVLVNNESKKNIVKATVEYVEQVFKEMHGKEKFEEAKKTILELLEEKKIKIGEKELKVLIESAVKEMNDFNNLNLNDEYVNKLVDYLENQENKDE